MAKIEAQQLVNEMLKKHFLQFKQQRHKQLKNYA